MTDTKTPPAPETGCAPLNRPMAETVSLEVVWAAAYAARAAVLGYPLYSSDVDNSMKTADAVVAALLDACPRGDR